MATVSGGWVAMLFANRKPIPIYPYMTGCQEINWPARRNKGKGYLSASLFKACAVALKGDVTGVTALEPPGRVMITSRSQSGGDEHRSALAGSNQFFTTQGKVTYDLGLIILADALAYPAEYPDLLDALETAQEAMATSDEGGAQKAMGHLADELYFALRYGGTAEPGKDSDRLAGAVIDSFASMPVYQPTLDLDVTGLTSVAALKACRNSPHREAEKGDATHAAPVDKPSHDVAAPLMKTTFRGWQLQELKDSLLLGMNAILIGPTATGKSLCVFEAKDCFDPPKPFFVIEGHESLKEFDLLGGYVPTGGGLYDWQDGILVQAMRAGGLLFCDEANRMPTRTLNVLLGVLTRKAVVLTEHGSEDVAAAKGFQVVLAMNLGKGYSVNGLDTALVNRFDITLEFRYLSPSDETDLLVEQTGIARDIASVMVKVANETRLKRKNKELTGELTPRSLRSWALKAMNRASGVTPTLADLKKAAELTWIPQVAGTDADGYVRDDVAQELKVIIESHMPGSESGAPVRTAFRAASPAGR